MDHGEETEGDTEHLQNKEKLHSEEPEPLTVFSKAKEPLVRVGAVLLAVRVITAASLSNSIKHILLVPSRLLALSDVHRAVKILVLVPLDSTVLIEVHAAEVSRQRLVNMLTLLSIDCQ